MVELHIESLPPADVLRLSFSGAGLGWRLIPEADAMAKFGDFDPILPDPQPLIEKALLLYERAVKSRRG